MPHSCGGPTAYQGRGNPWGHPVHRIMELERPQEQYPQGAALVSSKPILSLIAALALSVAGSTVARAQSTPSDEAGSQTAGSPTNDSQTKDTTKKTKKKAKKHPGMTKLDKLERGNPDSVYYKSRKKHAPNPTNAQIDAAETGVPASVDHPNRNVSPTTRPTPRSTRPRREIRPASITGRIRKRFSRRSGGAIACARSSEPGEAARVAVAASSSARSLSGGRRMARL